MFKKNQNTKGSSALWAGVAIFAVACGGGAGALSEKLDGGKTQANLGLKVQAAATSATAALVSAQNLTVTAGKACIEEIKVKLPAGISCADANFVKADNIKCEVESETEHGVTSDQAEIKVTGPILFDLVTGEATPSLADIAFPSGAYRDIEFRFGPSCALGGETSITLEGSMLDSSSVAHPFAAALENDDDLKIKSPTDIQVLEGQDNAVFANLVLNTWFASVDFVDCLDHGDLVADGGGVIQINKDTVATGACENIYEDIKDALKDSMEFEDRDVNDDGVDDHGGHGSDDLVR